MWFPSINIQVNSWRQSVLSKFNEVHLTTMRSLTSQCSCPRKTETDKESWMKYLNEYSPFNNWLTVCFLLQRHQCRFCLKDRKIKVTIHHTASLWLKGWSLIMNTFLMAVQSSSISMSLSIYTMYGPKKTDRHAEQVGEEGRQLL